MKRKEKLTKGLSDLQMLFTHLKSSEKKAKREAWLKEHYNKKEKGNEHKD